MASSCQLLVESSNRDNVFSECVVALKCLSDGKAMKIEFKSVRIVVGIEIQKRPDRKIYKEIIITFQNIIRYAMQKENKQGTEVLRK